MKKKGSVFQQTFRRQLAKLGYSGAIWAIAHKLCRLMWKVLHEGVPYVEKGQEPDPKTQERRGYRSAAGPAAGPGVIFRGAAFANPAEAVARSNQYPGDSRRVFSACPLPAVRGLRTARSLR